MKNKDYTEYLKMTPEELRKLQKTRGWLLSFVGLVVYGVLRLFGCKPKDYHGICQYFEIGESWGGLELGWFFICSKDVGEHTKMHEVGHNIQNAAVGGFRMAFLCIGSAIRYWVRRIFGAKTPYDSWWFEGQATSLGTEYVQKTILH
jgi:hypothetical protein